MMKYFLLSVFTLVNISLASAQNKVVFYVEAYPFNTEVMVDTMHIKPCSPVSYDHIYYLTEGKHVLKAWAPGYKLMVDTIQVKESTTGTKKIIRLTQTDTYKNYERLLGNYKTKKGMLVGLPALATLAMGVATFVKYKRADKYYEAALTAKHDYDVSITINEIASAKAKFIDQRDLYNKEMNTCKRNLFITGGLVMTELLTLHLASRLAKPTFTDNNPLSHVQVEFRSNFKTYSSLLLAYEF